MKKHRRNWNNTMMMVDFFDKNDHMIQDYEPEKFFLAMARLCDEDMIRLREHGDTLPHAIYANPALTEAKKRGISLKDSGSVTPIEPIYPTEDQLLGKTS